MPKESVKEIPPAKIETSTTLGNKIATIQKLKVIQINTEENILVIKGSVPGKPGNLLSIVPSE